MKRKLHIILVSVLLMFTVSSCESYKDIKVTSCGIVSITPSGLKSINAIISLGIHNPIIGFQIANLSGNIKYNDDHFLLFSAGDIKIKGHCDGIYEVPISGSLVEQFNLFQLLNIAVDRDLSGLKMDLTVKVALHNGLGKTLTFKDIPVQSLIKRL